MRLLLLLEISILAAFAGCGNIVVATGAGTTTGTSSTSTGAGTGGTGGTGGALSIVSTGIGTGGGIAVESCHTQSDCPSYDTCAAQGETLCGGPACPPTPLCNVDADCTGLGATVVCIADPCCGKSTCLDGCTSDAACAMGETCQAYHCVPTACASAADCPVDFDCDGGGCQRRPCTTDGVCDGYCVNGACYATPGMCIAVPV